MNRLVTDKYGKTTINISIFLTLVILTASMYFIFNGDSEFKVDIQKTRTQYYVYEDNSYYEKVANGTEVVEKNITEIVGYDYFISVNGTNTSIPIYENKTINETIDTYEYNYIKDEGWELAATEYIYLYDGTTKMRAQPGGRNLSWYNDSKYVYATRTTKWKDNITTIQTYTFSKYNDKIENVPISNNFTCINCEDKFVQFEIRDITYDGETKNIESPFGFGKNMEVEWQDDNDFSWAKVYQNKVANDKIIVKFRPDSDYEEYFVRLYDPLDDNIMAFFNFDEQDTTGTGTIIDATDNYNGTNVGASNTTGKINTAYDFDGSSDYINVSNGFSGVRSISIWFYSDANSGTHQVWELEGTNRLFLQQLTTDQIRVYGNSGSLDSTTSTTLTASTWYHFVFVIESSSSWKLYKNNTVIDSGSEDLTTGSYNNFIIGRHGQSSTNFFDGKLDIVGLWSSGLNSTFVSELWNNSYGIQYPFAVPIVDNPPSVILNSPDNNSIQESQYVVFNTTVTDDYLVQNVSLYVDGSLNQTNSSNFNGTYIFNVSIPECNHNWSILAYDNVSKINQSETRHFISDFYNPSVNISFPEEGVDYSYKPTTLNSTASDIHLDTCWYSLDDFSTNTTFTCNTNVTGLSADEGSNTWWSCVNDTAEHENCTSVTFNVDSVEPFINITYPLNNTYNLIQTILNYTANDTHGSRCWYSIDSGATNSSDVAFGTNFTGLSSSEGGNIWRVYCNDTYSNENSSTVYFTQDTTPFIEFISPTPANNTNLSQSYIETKVNLTEAYFQNLTIYLYNDSLVDSYFTADATREYNFTSLVDGDYYINATTWASTGATNSTETRKVTLDNVNPEINVVSPLNQTYQQTYITYEVYSNEDLEYCNFTIDNYSTNYSMSEINSTLFRYNMTSIDDGGYTAKFECSDYAGNINNTEQVTFIKKLIYVILNSPSNGYINPASVVTFNYSTNTTNEFYLVNSSLFTNISGSWSITNTTTFPDNSYHVYDEINDSSINTSLWSYIVNTGSSASENNDKLTLSSSGGGGNPASSAGSLSSIDTQDIDYLRNITLRVVVSADGNDAGASTTTFNLGGQTIRTVSYSGVLVSDDSVWNFLRNESCGTNCFDVYDDGVYSSSKNFSSSGIGCTTSATGIVASGSTGNAVCDIYYVYYEELNYTNYTGTWDNQITELTNWNVRTCISDGNCTFADNNFTVDYDRFDPIVNITNPTNGDYWEEIPFLNYTASDDYPDSCWFSNDSGVNNYSVQTFGGNFTINAPFGFNKYYVFCNDSNNNIGQDSVNFTKNRINFTGSATNNTAPADFTSQNWVYLDVNDYDVNQSNITFSIYTQGGYSDIQTFTNDTDSYNFTGLSLDYYFFNVTVCYNDTGLCYSTPNRYYGNQTLNFTINGAGDNVLVELGTQINLSASTNYQNVSFDITHPNYGNNQNNSLLTSTLNLIIDFFRNTLFSSGESYSNHTFDTINASGNSNFSLFNFTIPVHQYDYIENLSVNISGNVNQGNSSNEPVIVIYKANNLSAYDKIYYGNLSGDYITLYKFAERDISSGINWSSQKNASFENLGDQLIYVPLTDGIDVVSVLLNISGFEYGFEYFNDFENSSDIDSILSDNTMLDVSESIMLPKSSLQNLVYDNFNDSSFNTTKFYKDADVSLSPGDYTLDYSTTETGGYARLYHAWTSGGGYNFNSGPFGIAPNLSYFNLRDNENIIFNLSSTYSSNADNEACAGNAYVLLGGATVWTSYYENDTDTGSNQDESSSATLTFNMTKQSNGQWNVKISGSETSSVTINTGCGDRSGVYNWTNGSYYITLENCDDLSGTLNNDFNRSVNYNTYPIFIRNQIIGTDDYCEANTVDTKVYFINRSLYYRNNGTLFSNSIFDSSADINSITLNATSLEWTSLNHDTSIYYYLSADDGDNWESATNNATHNFANPGKNIKFKIEINTTSPGYLESTPWIENITLETEKGNPSNVSVDFGNDGTYDYTSTGEINETNGSIEINLSSADLSDIFSGSPSGSGDLYLVPIKVYSATRGIVQLDALNITYNPNPIYLNLTSLKNKLLDILGFGNINISVGAINGTINITDLRYDYAGGNKTYEILAHTQNYTINKTINATYYFSQWDYEFVPYGVDFIYFQPGYPTEKNVSVYGQSSNVPILNITSLGYGGKNATLSVYLNDTLSCVETTLSLTGNKSDGVFINESWVDLTNMEYEETVNISLWADYSCNYNNWRTFNPYILFRTCTDDTLCDTGIV